MSLEYSTRNYSGVAPETTLVGTIGTGDTAWTIADGTGYPTANFPIVIDYDNGSLEKCYVGARSSASLTGVLRAQDGTTAKSHSSGAKIRHVAFAEDFVEANAMAAALTTKGDIPVKGATATSPPSRLAVGATNGQVLTVDSAQTLGLKYSTLGVIPGYTSTANRDAALPSPAAAQAVYLDTGDTAEGLYFYNGSAWRKSWNEPWGRVAGTTSTATTAGITTDADLVTATWTAVTGRRYRIYASGIFNQVTSSGIQFLKITDNTPTQLQVSQRNVTVNNTETHSAFIEVTPTAGSVTYRARVSTNAGSITLQGGATQPHQILVDDVGPSGNPT